MEFRANPWSEVQTRMRPRASHPGPHCSCVPDLPCHRGGGAMRLQPDSARPSECRSAKPSRRDAIVRRQLTTLRWPAAFLLLRRAEGGGGRRPGATSRASAFLDASPPALHSRESPVTAGSAAIIRPSQKLSRFAAHTLRHFVAPRNTKNTRRCAETVDVESSLWKPEEI